MDPSSGVLAHDTGERYLGLMLEQAASRTTRGNLAKMDLLLAVKAQEKRCGDSLLMSFHEEQLFSLNATQPPGSRLSRCRLPFIPNSLSAAWTMLQITPFPLLHVYSVFHDPVSVEPLCCRFLRHRLHVHFHKDWHVSTSRKDPPHLCSTVVLPLPTIRHPTSRHSIAS